MKLLLLGISIICHRPANTLTAVNITIITAECTVNPLFTGLLFTVSLYLPGLLPFPRYFPIKFIGNLLVRLVEGESPEREGVDLLML